MELERRAAALRRRLGRAVRHHARLPLRGRRGRPARSSRSSAASSRPTASSPSTRSSGSSGGFRTAAPWTANAPLPGGDFGGASFADVCGRVSRALSEARPRVGSSACSAGTASAPPRFSATRARPADLGESFRRRPVRARARLPRRARMGARARRRALAADEVRAAHDRRRARARRRVHVGSGMKRVFMGDEGARPFMLS